MPLNTEHEIFNQKQQNEGMVIGKSEVDRARGPTVLTILLRDYVYPLLRVKLLPVAFF